jgi:hypothetical protein
LAYQAGLGQIKQLKGSPDNIVDLVPADYVSNFMIVTMAFTKEKKGFYNFSTSTKNPLRLGYFIEILNEYWRSHRINNTSPS